MADFEKALAYLMVDEDPRMTGDVVPDPVKVNPDPDEKYRGKNAVARFGINSHCTPEAVSEGFYQSNDETALRWAANFYKYRFFSPIGGYQILSQDITNKFFDLAVNMGLNQATKLVQAACNEMLGSVAIGYLPLTIDGVPGQHTLDAINACEDSAQLLARIRGNAAGFYRDIAKREGWSQNELDAQIKRATR